MDRAGGAGAGHTVDEARSVFVTERGRVACDEHRLSELRDRQRGVEPICDQSARVGVARSERHQTLQRLDRRHDVAPRLGVVLDEILPHRHAV